MTAWPDGMCNAGLPAARQRGPRPVPGMPLRSSILMCHIQCLPLETRSPLGPHLGDVVPQELHPLNPLHLQQQRQ